MLEIRNGILWALVVIFLLSAMFGVYSRLQKRNLLSPVLGISKIRFSDNVWFPREASGGGFLADAPKISAKAVFFVEAQTGRILFAKNPETKLPIASLTKIMTVIVAMENRSIAEVMKVSERAASMEPDKMLLIPGEELTVEQLLDGIFLVSANDAAEVLAEKTIGRREEFINLMNSKALQLGMVNTFFINPTGLQEEGVSQYSSAYDVALMSRYAIYKWPQLLDISSKPHIYIPKSTTHQDYDMYSGINLLSSYPGVLGFKTGYTPEAGLTLVTFAKKGDYEVLGVLLGSEDRRDDARALLDYSFEKLGVKN